MIDPSHLFRNEIPPPVHVEGVTADGKQFSAVGDSSSTTSGT